MSYPLSPHLAGLLSDRIHYDRVPQDSTPLRIFLYGPSDSPEVVALGSLAGSRSFNVFVMQFGFDRVLVYLVAYTVDGVKIGDLPLFFRNSDGTIDLIQDYEPSPIPPSEWPLLTHSGK